MTEIITEVKTYRIDRQCPKCKVGFMRPNGTALMSFPAQYGHNCNVKDCLHFEYYYEEYPYITYE